MPEFAGADGARLALFAAPEARGSSLLLPEEMLKPKPIQP